ncbi:hypothetical protein ATI61_111192 [Archangium gephyra]|uniref:Transmembrane protein n=1 Tax=Archangium gephyra TaxID=48 RepID=A0ABX9JT20_9BACT|nr:hypothetical protein ATI61_111192 [Archangium gephyra]
MDGPLCGTNSRHVKTTSPWRLIAVGLGFFLASCSAPRASLPTPTSAQELSRSVLILEKTPGGQITHSWEPLSSFDLSKLPYRASSTTVEGPIVRAAWTRDCEEESDACMDMCRKSLRGRNWSHANKGSKEEDCRRRCRPAYLGCCQLREQAEALKFTAADNAVLWLKQHHEELLVGTVVIITGVAFIVTVVGSGGTTLVLVPALLLVSSETPIVPQLAQVKP